MSITTTQKLIKIGTSRGITLPAKILKQLDIKDNDEIDVTIHKKVNYADTEHVLKTAGSILERYKKDFENLANR